MVSVFFDITDLPADFGNAETATITVRTRGQQFSGTNEITDDFTGTNGDPWDATIWNDDDMPNGSSTIQNNEGELEASGTDSDNSAARQLTEASHGDFDALWKHRFLGGTDEDKRFGFEFRRSLAWATQPDAPDTGYQLHHQQGTDRIRLYRFDGDGVADPIATDLTIDRTQTHWFRVLCVGSSIKVRWWVDGNSEPATWDFDVTDGAFTTGAAFSFTQWRGAGDNPRQSRIDDLSIDITSGGSGSTVKLYAQLFQSDETTTLSDEVEVASHSSDSSFANSAAITFTGLNTTADKSVWDNARVRFRWGT